MEAITINNKPLYKHDCTKCVYLDSENAKDFYFCKKNHSGDNASLIIRLSNNPSDYYSMPANIAEQGILSGEIKDSVFDKCFQLYKSYISNST